MRPWRIGLLMILTMACTSGRSADPSGALIARDANLITAGELSRSTGLVNAWDAVERLRPRFLRNSGPLSFSGGLDNRPIVRVDDTVAGAPEALRTIDIAYVLEIRYYSAPDATARFGGTYGRAVIHVVTKAR